MDLASALALLLFVLLPLWAVITSPVIAGFVLVTRRLPERTLRSSWTLAAAAVAFALLASPVPTPIVTILVPLGLALVMRDETFVGPEVDPFQVRWVVLSFAATAAVAFLVLRHGRGWWSAAPQRTKACSIGLLALWGLASFASS